MNVVKGIPGELGRQLQDLFDWIDNYNGDVDKGALRDECYNLVNMWHYKSKKIIPTCVLTASPLEKIEFIYNIHNIEMPIVWLEYNIAGRAKIYNFKYVDMSQ